MLRYWGPLALSQTEAGTRISTDSTIVAWCSHMKIEVLAEHWIKKWSYDDDDPRRKQYDWLFDLEYELIHNKPQEALRFIIEVLSLDSGNIFLAVLAAGPLEDLLVYNGDKIIGAVEQEAAINPRFATLLGGVWKRDMKDHVWEKVLKVRDCKGWDNT